MASNLYRRSLSIARNQVAQVERQILEATEAGKPTKWASENLDRCRRRVAKIEAAMLEDSAEGRIRKGVRIIRRPHKGDYYGRAI